jgi:phosphoglycerate dehydrogenase-like enzyme
MDLNCRMARAVAEEAVLLMLAAHRDPAAAARLQEQGRAELAKAFALNPRLRAVYAPLAGEWPRAAFNAAAR